MYDASSALESAILINNYEIARDLLEAGAFIRSILPEAMKHWGVNNKELLDLINTVLTTGEVPAATGSAISEAVAPAGSDRATPPVEEEAMESWAVEEKPELISEVAPKYPEAAREESFGGKVFVNILVGKDGHVKNAKVVRGPEAFRQAAIDAAMQFVFEPAKQGGKPVPVWVPRAISFSR